MVVKKIREIIEREYGFKLDTKSRQRKYVEARSFYYKFVREYTRHTTDGLHSLQKVADTLNKHHGTVINGLNRLDGFLDTKDKRIVRLYTELKGLIKAEIGDILDGDIVKDPGAVNEDVYNELVKDYNSLLGKFNYIKGHLKNYRPNDMEKEEFKVEPKSFVMFESENAS